MNHIKKRLTSLLLCVVMLIGLIPAHVLALANTPAEQIGNHFAADTTTGTLAVKPELTGNTSKSYADGWVLTDKTIAAGKNENEFLITLDVRTKAEIEEVVLSEDAATVIVLDLSNSMVDRPHTDRLEKAKAAAIAFVNSFAETGSTDTTRKIAVVGFSGEQPSYNILDGVNPGIVAATTYKG